MGIRMHIIRRNLKSIVKNFYIFNSQKEFKKVEMYNDKRYKYITVKDTNIYILTIQTEIYSSKKYNYVMAKD